MHWQRRSKAAGKNLYRDSCGKDRSWTAGPGDDDARSDCSIHLYRGRDEQPGKRYRQGPHEAGGVPQLCDWGAGPKGSVTTALYWDTADPFHYVRLQKEGDHEVLIVGGEDHKTGQADDTSDRFNRLEQWMRQRFARAGTTEYRWSGQVMESIDGLAFIGSNSALEPNIYIATGDSGNGMTHGTVAGMPACCSPT
jgi:glycine/D-amino acid oxidase-like deaminating enzyme